ncbi:MAG: ferrochelatase, partial [Acidobacteriota bacterium]|nr:ferrochelatase [Acidobacteriota bacterium]
AEAGRVLNTPFLTVVPPVAPHPAFIASCAGLARPVIDRVRPQRVIFSFHGLPESQIRKSDASGAHCLVREGCCREVTDANRYCFRAQCFATARRLGDALDVPEDERLVGFQSRLGRRPWIRPYTDEILKRLPREGVRRAVIVAPGFAADCLETLEELAIRGAEDFRRYGGEELAIVPSLNATDAWVDAVVRIVREEAPWLAGSPVRA